MELSTAWKPQRRGRHASLDEDLFTLLVDSVRDYAIVLLDGDGAITTWGNGAQRLTGYAAAEALGQPFSLFFPASAVALGAPAQQLRSALRNGRFEEEGWRVRKNGKTFWADVVITAIRDRRGKRHGYATITRDLSEHKALKESEERFRMLAESGRDHAIFSIDRQGMIETWNVGARIVTGHAPEDVLGKSFGLLFDRADLPATRLHKLLQQAARQGRSEHECWSTRRDASRFWSSLAITALHDPDGRPAGYAVVTRDLTVRKRVDELTQQHQELQDQVLRDPLTGAFNRRHFLARLAEAIAAPDKSRSLLLIDIDHFKSINDRHGHPAGDKVLEAVAAVSRRLSRQTDGVFRVGGDEFAVILPGATLAKAIKVAERLRTSVESWDEADATRATVSVGVAQLQDGDSIESWIGRADAALYEAKRSGRNHVAC